jgi:hypothetical protein
MSYIKPVPGLSSFAMVSAISIIDPALSYRHRLVLSILALHANATGKTEPSQERIASLAGWFKENKKTGEVRPNVSYVSSLINNENHTKAKDRCGPGLVQLGYVKPGHKQKGFNQTNTYFLITPLFQDGHIHRPDGTKVKVPFTAPAPREDTKAYKARKAAEQEAYELTPVPPKKKFSAADQLPLDLADTYVFMGDEYTRRDCEMDLVSWQDGFQRNVPDVAYRHFQITIPSHRDSDC